MKDEELRQDNIDEMPEENLQSTVPRDSIQLNLFRYFKQRIMEDLAKNRPHGKVGILYDKVCKYGTNNPRGEIERMAEDAFSRGIISDREYTVLKYRVPFPGTEHKTLEDLGKSIIKKRIIIEEGICKEAVRFLEATAYGKLYRHYMIGIKFKGEKIPWTMGY